MHVTLTPQLEAMIQRRVESGCYQDASDVVRTALRLLEAHEQTQRLRALLESGLAQAERGDVVEFNAELAEIIERRAEQRFRRGDEPDPDVCP
jgi:antitoxin ParD1/3/4